MQWSKEMTSTSSTAKVLTARRTMEKKLFREVVSQLNIMREQGFTLATNDIQNEVLEATGNNMDLKNPVGVS